jgi:hypothetical protein
MRFPRQKIAFLDLTKPKREPTSESSRSRPTIIDRDSAGFDSIVYLIGTTVGLGKRPSLWVETKVWLVPGPLKSRRTESFLDSPSSDAGLSGVIAGIMAVHGRNRRNAGD